ncbi:beta strand repeat-containing protein [Maribacter sp. 2308TA10-17]|uniref:beta strand repeat-containing protein n=1 Tax=Maribacter sp. 2308TA10-17 TaxID=3386276 RepID=UPI0039BD314A
MKNRVPFLTVFCKQSIVILLFLLSLTSSIAQVKIGDNPENIDPASLLELESTDKTMVLSRITTAQMQAITPLQGAVIYNLEEQCVFYYNGSNWVNLCRDGNGFSIVDNGDNTYTVNDGTNPEFTFSTNTETITSINQNADGTYIYTNEAGEEFEIPNGSGTGTGSLSITDNGDNTYTFNDGTIPAFTLSANPETATSIVQNTDGSYTYTNEANVEFEIANGSGNGSLSIVDNGDDTYTVNDGTNPEFIITAKPETITRIVENGDGSFTYFDEANGETTITSSSLSIVDNGDDTYTVNDGTNPEFIITAKPETITRIVENGDGSFTYFDEANGETTITSSSLSIVDNGDDTYTVNDGTNPEFIITAKPETVTRIVENGDGSFTYFDEANGETTITSSSLSIVDNGDDTYTVNDGTNPEFIITAKPETVTRIVENGDGSFTYFDEANGETTISSSSLSIVDNGDDTYTVNDGTNPEFTITAKPETITSITENGNGTYTYTNEANETVTISFSGTSEQGSVFFADDNNGLAESNGQFFWDNANSRLGLGTNTNLTDRLTLNGSIGISDGSVTEPSYRFSADPDTGIFRAADDELGFTVGGSSNMKLTNGGLNLNDALPLTTGFNDMPLLIRAKENELFGLQRNNGELKWIVNLFQQTESVRGGLRFDEAGFGTRFFIENARNPGGPDFGRIGINTQAPQSTLHVVGTMRVTDLPPSQVGDTFVTVDGAGNFRKSANAQPVVTGGGRWTNATEPLSLSGGVSNIPIFDDEDYNDGTTEFYEVNSNILTIKSDGRYDIAATISLVGNVKADGSPGNTRARITVNGSEVGAINVAANSGSTESNAFSSIHISDVLNLQKDDLIRIKLLTNVEETLEFAGPQTSVFTIKKL